MPRSTKRTNSSLSASKQSIPPPKQTIQPAVPVYTPAVPVYNPPSMLDTIKQGFFLAQAVQLLIISLTLIIKKKR